MQAGFAIQLYSLRDRIPGRVPETLETLRGLGFSAVELAGAYGLSAPELRRMLDGAGLSCAGAHVPMNALGAEAFGATADFYRTLGTDRLIVPSAPLSDLPAVINELNGIHARAKAAGMKAGYHNHDREFARTGGPTAFERIFAGTPPDFLVQLDIGWATAAGENAPDLVRRYAERIETVHLKEHRAGDLSAVPGEGEADWPGVFRALRDVSRLEWLILEQEQHAGDPIDSIGRGLRHLRKQAGEPSDPFPPEALS